MHTVNFSQQINKLITSGTRQLCILSGEESWAIVQAKQIENQHYKNTLWVKKNCQQYLGVEFSAVVYNSFLGFNPDDFAMISGCVKAGGLLILLCPALNDWPYFECPDYQRFLSTNQKIPIKKHYLQWLVNNILNNPDVIFWQQSNTPIFGNVTGYSSQVARRKQEELSNCQQTAIEAAEHVILGHRNRPLIITGDRGRGKSALLGIIAEKIVKHANKSVIISGPKPDSIKIAQKHTSKDLNYIPPDVLLEKKPITDILLIDEAAGIPTHMLTAILKHYKRIIFATTTHGYEGTGTGFKLRFFKILAQHCKKWRHIELVTPIRWAENCLLEKWVNQVFLLKNTLKTINKQNLIDNLEFEPINQAELNSRDQLESIYSLLAHAHYQTKPSHLRFLLDSPDLKLFVAHFQNNIVGIIECIPEGNLNHEFSLNIMHGQRRAHGHLCAQQLTIAQQNPEFCKMNSYRIHRITVHPQWQRLRIGKKLVQFTINQLIDSVDYISVCFGANPELLRFWPQTGFELAHIGIKRETNTGEYTAVYLYSKKHQNLIQQSQENLYNRFIFSLKNTYKYLSANLVHLILRQLPAVNNNLETDIERVRLFLEGKINLEYCQENIYNYALWLLQNQDDIEGTLLKILVQYFLQHHDKQDVFHTAKLYGMKQIISHLKQAISF